MILALPKVSLITFAMLCALGISVFLHTYKIQTLSLNEDEAAQGYNTYSVLQTGYDEYGRIPLRYLSFGENKLPLTGALSAPFIILFGLNDLTVRLPILLIGISLPFLFYGAAFALTQSKRIAIVACLLASTNTWLYTTSRHQHEAVVLVAITLLTLSLIYRYLAHTSTPKPVLIQTVMKVALLLFMGLYTYHSGKISMPFLGIVTLALIWKYHKNLLPITFVLIAMAFLIFGATEMVQPNNRMASLSYFTAPVFTHEIEEGRRLGGSSLYYNKFVYGVHKAIVRTLGYLSPQFLLINSDPNPRYGSPQVRLLTVVEYIFFIIGLVVIWLRKHPTRFLLISLLFVGAFPAAAALPTDSLTRSLLVTIPLLIIMGIGIVYVWDFSKTRSLRMQKILIACLVGSLLIHMFGIISSARAYFTQYLESPHTQKAWQSGTKEMADYVWVNYTRFDTFYITRSYGQPYIFLLFYKPYPPSEYQKIAKPGKYNEYGFWEQDNFDKFIFQKPLVYNNVPRSAFIMTPEEVQMNNLDPQTLKQILHNGKVRFYVRENK